MRWKPFNILIFISIPLLYLGVSSCSTERKVLINEREVLIKSLPKDNSWLTKVKWTALKHGKRFAKDSPVYIWSSKKIYVDGEEISYQIWYFAVYAEGLAFSKKHGSLLRIVVCNESANNYGVSDYDFEKRVADKDITKEEAEELAYNFFKELYRYGLE